MAWGLDCFKDINFKQRTMKEVTKKRRNTALRESWELLKGVSFTLRGARLTQWCPSLCSSVSSPSPPSHEPGRQQTCIPQAVGSERYSAVVPMTFTERAQFTAETVSTCSAAAPGLTYAPTLNSHPSVVSVFKWTYVFTRSQKSEVQIWPIDLITDFDETWTKSPCTLFCWALLIFMNDFSHLHYK